jgi:hypothetical protein
MSVFPELWMLGEKDHEFKASLGYIVRRSENKFSCETEKQNDL